MRKGLLVGLVVLIAGLASAQQDQKAKEILDKVSEKTRSFSTLSADFTFNMKNVEMEIDEKSKGSIKFKGNKYSVDLPDVGMQIFCDGTTLWNYMENGNQVTISNLEDEGSDLMNPSSLFSIYEQGFDSKFVAEANEDGKTVYQIELNPQTDEHDVSKIMISITKSTLLIHSATLYSTDGNLYGINVSKMETNTDIADSEFTFDASKYGDVEEIDLR